MAVIIRMRNLELTLTTQTQKDLRPILADHRGGKNTLLNVQDRVRFYQDQLTATISPLFELLHRLIALR